MPSLMAGFSQQVQVPLPACGRAVTRSSTVDVIVGSNGSLTGYAGGLGRKKAFLALEAS